MKNIENHEQYTDSAVKDLVDSMKDVKEALASGDPASAKDIYDYLVSKSSDYKDISYYSYDIVSCMDYAYDVYESLANNDQVSRENLLSIYDTMFANNNGDWNAPDNVVHSSGAYSGPGA